MDRVRRRDRRVGRGLLVRGAVVLGVLLLPATFPLASATFAGVTSTHGGTVAAATLEPPSGLGVTQTCAPGPGITFRSRATATGVSTVTVPLPANVAENDLLLAQVGHRQTKRTITAPAGWALLEHEQHLDGSSTGSAVTAAVFWKRASAAEPTSAKFTLAAGNSVEVVGVMAAYIGVHRTDPIHASGATMGMASTASTAAVATTLPDVVLVHALVKRQELLPAPAGTNPRWGLQSSNTGTAWIGATGSDELRAVAGPGVVRTSSASTFVSEWVALTVALRPALGAPSASLSWTPSASSSASGYQLERVVSGVVEANWTVDPVSASTATDGPLVNGTAYTYRVRTYLGTWTSSPVTVDFTPAC